MSIVLGLGSNQGNRAANLDQAIRLLQSEGFAVDKVSPLVESPALLPAAAEADWNLPYLNAAVRGTAKWTPQQGLSVAKRIETALGRHAAPRWSPRPIDIDLLYWHAQCLSEPNLTLPHGGASQRDFVLTPLLHLDPSLRLGAHSVFQHSLARRPIPLWMAIVNVTPDSFSDGGNWSDSTALETYLDELIDQNIPIIDIGAESTRPAAASLEPQQEWQRLQPVLAYLREKLSGRYIKPWVSVDSRHYATADKALAYGVDMLNDVTGLCDRNMQAVARSSGLPVVAMHSLSVPVVAGHLLPPTPSAVAQLKDWVEKRQTEWVANGLDLNQVLLDPGIGFGKSSLQAFELLQHCQTLRQCGHRLLVGHSRKSFMRELCQPTGGQGASAARDSETLGISLALCQQGVDIIRVHAALRHQRAYRGWMHVIRST